MLPYGKRRPYDRIYEKNEKKKKKKKNGTKFIQNIVLKI